MWLKRFLSKLPLLSGLEKCTVEDHSSAVKEIFFTLIFSFSPIYIVIIGDYLFRNDNSAFDFWLSLKKTILNGELFLYITSLIAPIFYTVLRERESGEKFPSKLSNMFVYIGIVFVAAISFAFQRSGSVDQEAFFNLSKILFFIAVPLYYLVLVYNNNLLPDPAARMRKNEDDFQDKLSKHRR